jgi:trk system potassium uptake protein TrkA
MRVIIVGCGRLGATLAIQLYRNGHQVTVVDQNQSAFDNLSTEFHGRVIEGDVLARNVLQRAEIEQADALAAVTRSDTLNALVAHIARAEYQVPRVVARNYNPRLRPLQEAFGIPVIGSASWGARQIEDVLSDVPLRAVLLDSNSSFAIYQLEVPETWQGHPIHELLPEGRVMTLAWTRAGQGLMDTGAQILGAGDLIYLSAVPEEIDELQRQLGSREERKA